MLSAIFSKIQTYPNVLHSPYMVIILFQERYHKSTEKYRKYRGTGTGDLVGSRGVHRHPYCRVFKLKKSKKRKIRIFEKPDFPVRIRIRWYRNIRGVTLRSQEVRRSEKKRKKNFRKNRISRIRIRISVSLPRLLNGGAEGYL